MFSSSIRKFEHAEDHVAVVALFHEREQFGGQFGLCGLPLEVVHEKRCYETIIDNSFDIGYGEIHLGDLAPDGTQLRPHIVWFGEAVPKIEQAIDAVEKADILLIVGTSLQVYPAAGLYRYAGNGTPVYIIDPKEVPVSDSRITHIKDVATKGMETFKNILNSK